MAIDTETMQLIERVVARAVSNATSLKGASDEIAKGVTQYVGARYVPLFAEPLEWDKTKAYEPLTIVLYQGNSFTSRQYVPTGVEIDNESFWANTGNYNAQVEQYRQEVKTYDGRITANADAIAKETEDRTAAVDAEKTRATAAEQTLQGNIDAEKTRATAAEQTLQGNIDDVLKQLRYTVGADQPYKTIESAVKTANAVGGNAFIFITPGTYNESINMYNYEKCDSYTFFAPSLGSVIWKSDKNYGYNYPCINASKSIYCENIVFVKGSPSLTGSGNGGYAVHQDSEHPDITAIYSNCRMISYENAAFGCGTRTNNDVRVMNCHLISYKKNNKNGALLYHSGPVGTIGEKFTLIGNVVQGLNDGCYGCNIYKTVGSKGEDSEYIFIDNFISGKQLNADVSGISIFTPTDNETTWESSATTWYGNNLDEMNYSSNAMSGPLSFGIYKPSSVDKVTKKVGFFYSSDNTFGLGFRLNSEYGCYYSMNPITGKSNISLNGSLRDAIGLSPLSEINYFDTTVYAIGCIVILNVSSVLPAHGTLPNTLKPKTDTVIAGTASDGSISKMTLKTDGTYTIDKPDKAYTYNAIYIRDI